MSVDLIRETLEQHVNMRLAAGADMPLGRLVLGIGKGYEGISFADKRRPSRKCYENALKYAEAKGLRYAEGYGLSGTLLKGGCVFPVEHAWCVDRDGRAVDPTWEEPEASFYMGIEFDVWQVWRRVSQTGTFGMFHKGPTGAEDVQFMQSLAPHLDLRPRRRPGAGAGLPKP